jgi:hypothetical protein
MSVSSLSSLALNVNCYHPPLELKFARSECYPSHPPAPVVDDTFLETTFRVEGGRIRHWLKNDNPRDGPTRVWRYHHFASYCSYEQKRATLMACMKKVHAMASDESVLHVSALQSWKSFADCITRWQ